MFKEKYLDLINQVYPPEKTIANIITMVKAFESTNKKTCFDNELFSKVQTNKDMIYNK